MTEATKNLLGLYRKATPAELRAGREWYRKARSFCEDLASRGEVSLRQAVKATAAMSPRCSWKQNKRNACALILGDGEPKGLSVGIEKAERICNGERRVLRGPKDRAFAAAILGWPAAVVDAHMARVCGKSARLTQKEYRECAEAIRQAADSVGIPTHVFQAVVWIVQRTGEQPDLFAAGAE